MTTKVEPHSPELVVGAGLPPWLETVRDQVNHLRYGQIQIVVHDARVVQIERIEKFRFDPPSSASSEAVRTSSRRALG